MSNVKFYIGVSSCLVAQRFSRLVAHSVSRAWLRWREQSGALLPRGSGLGALPRFKCGKTRIW